MGNYCKHIAHIHVRPVGNRIYNSNHKWFARIELPVVWALRHIRMLDNLRINFEKKVEFLLFLPL